MSYPAFVDGAPPVVTLKEYDVAPWAGTTCVDRQASGYVVVVMQEPTKVVARIHKDDDETLDKIFRSAHSTHASQGAK
ncbi:hypothetical protein CAAN1_30S00980 [[Candida] anglica]|uniref:Uncharacterized protein n=1 Tax=[Candida] anglica TaxID=148631 RepID=A0ABP0EFA1_9ASCO